MIDIQKLFSRVEDEVRIGAVTPASSILWSFTGKWSILEDGRLEVQVGICWDEFFEDGAAPIESCVVAWFNEDEIE